MFDNSQKTILVIDDEYDIRDVLMRFLSELGYKVKTASNLSETVFILNQDFPDIVFLDIVLPQLDGIEILKLIKQMKKDSVVIMMSGYRDESDAKKSLQLGAFDYITKPFNMEYIENMLNMIQV